MSADMPPVEHDEGRVLVVVAPPGPRADTYRRVIARTDAHVIAVGSVGEALAVLGAGTIDAVLVGSETSSEDTVRLLVGLETASTHARTRAVIHGELARLLALGNALQGSTVVALDAEPGALVRAVEVAPAPPGSIRFDEIAGVSCLAALSVELEDVQDRLAAAYGVSQCLVAIDAGADSWSGAVQRTVVSSDWSGLLDRAKLAATLGTTVVTAVRESLFAVALQAPDCSRAGLVCLVADDVRVFSAREQQALRALAARFGAELAWAALYDRMVGELDQIRDAARFVTPLGVWNRAGIERITATELAAARRRDQPCSVIAIDIVGLGAINAAHGHAGGDALIRHVAEAVQRCVRAEDVVGRIGGDEFAILCNATAQDAVVALARRIARGVEAEPVAMPSGERVRACVAAGVAYGCGNGERAVELLSRAARGARRARGADPVVVDPPRRTQPPRMSLQFAATGLPGASTLGGAYRLLHEISRGAMGVVYRAQDLWLERPVAIKMLRPDLATDAALVARFRTEAGILAQLRHPNLVQIYAFGRDGDDTYFAMELVEGEPVDDALSRCRREGGMLSFRQVKRVVQQVAAALDALHERGVVHRDVKPANIVLEPFKNRAVLVDVGIARRHGDEDVPAGTPGYVAPEVVAGGDASPRSDVYGLAATAYAMLALREAFPGSHDLADVLRRQRETAPPSLVDVAPELGGADALFARALSPKPERRPASAGELADALATVLDRAMSEAEPDSRRATAELAARIDDGEALDPDDAVHITGEFDDLRDTGSTSVTRALVFRAVPRVVGVRKFDDWRRRIRREAPGIARALDATVAPLSWVPSSLFTELLHHSDATEQARMTFARELGRATIRASFRRLFPASAATLAPAQTLSALAAIWRRYHSWGTPVALLQGSNCVAVRIEDPAESAAVCAWIEGLLEQLVTLSGGRGAQASHPHCVSRANDQCEFKLAWTSPGT